MIDKLAMGLKVKSLLKTIRRKLTPDGLIACEDMIDIVHSYFPDIKLSESDFDDPTNLIGTLLSKIDIEDGKVYADAFVDLADDVFPEFDLAKNYRKQKQFLEGFK